jgi:cytochrome c-type biogenesis protein
VSDWFTDQAAAGSLALAVPVALLAGLVSFFSPCVIPLLPGYLSYATGLSGADLENARRGRMLSGALLFVLGFAVVFVAIGTAAGSLGGWLIDWKREITVVLGLVTIVLGLMFAGLLPGLQRDWRVHQVPAVGLAAAPLLGFLFGLGLPFILAALAYRRALAVFAVVRRHQLWVMRAGGLMLVLVGVLLVTGLWDQMVQWLQVFILSTETPV